MNLKFYNYQPPDNLKTATKNLLAAMLRYPLQLPSHIKSLNPAHLNNCGDNGKTCSVILSEYTSKGHYNIASISAKTKRKDLIQIAGLPLDSDLDFYVEIFNSEYNLSATIEAHTQAIAEMHRTGTTLSGITTFDAICGYFALDVIEKPVDWRSAFREQMENKLNGIVRKSVTMNKVPGLCDKMDEFEPKTVTVIAARPGMGKTQLVLNIVNGFESQGAHGVIYSLEMPGVQLARRLLAMEARVNYKADWLALDEIRKQEIRDAVNKITASNFEFVENVTLSQLIADARIRKKQGLLDYVVVDHIGLVETDGKSNTITRVSDVTRKLKNLAMELDIPVIELSQLSRAVETRGGSRRPILSDLRDSGTVEQDADNIIFIYRAEYYDITEDEQGQSTEGIAELIIAKYREGPPDTAICGYHPILGFVHTEYEARERQSGGSVSGFKEYSASRSDNEPPGTHQTQSAYGSVNRDIDTDTIPF